jgi:iron complex outermembrane receptor protein
MTTAHSRRAYTALICSLLAIPVVADEDTAAEKNTSLPSIVVTATKLEKDPIDVPFGLTVFNAEALKQKRINTVYDALKNTPNVDIVSSGDGRANAIKIRGVGPLGGPANVEDTSVVVYVDGIPQPLSAIENTHFDAERIEVLKGPQGTLFGRNTTGGAVNIITPTPTADSELSISISGGENGHYSLGTVASGELSPGKVFGRIAFTSQGDDAYIENKIGTDIGENKKEAVRGTLFFTPTDDTDIKVTLSAEKDNRTFSVIGLRPENGQDFVTSLDKPNNVDKDAYGLGVTLNHDAENVRFTSATGVNRVKTDLLTDDTDSLFFTPNFSGFFGSDSTVYDNTAQDTSDWREEHTTISQEFRLSSAEDADVEWVSGVSFYKSNFDTLYKNQATFNSASSNGTREGQQETRSNSIFGELTLPVSKDVSVVAGLRSTNEKKTEDLSYIGNGATGTVASATRKQDLEDKFITGRTSVIVAIDPFSRVFATISSGHKTGGFQRFSTNIATGSLADDTYTGSDITAYEMGFKHRAGDGSMTFDLSLFYNDLDNEQVSQFDPTVSGFKTLNVDASTYGVELHSSHQLSSAFRLSSNLGYTVAEMNNLEAEFISLVKGKDGNTLPNTPEWTGGMSLQYRDRAKWIGNKTELFTDISWQYIGKRQGNISNSFTLKPFSEININTGFVLNDNIKISAFVRNLLDENKEQFGFDFFNNKDDIGVSVGRGRVIGLELAASF